MHILQITPTYIPAYRYGGPIYVVHGLCKSLVKLGHNVHVFTTSVDGNKDSDVPLGQPIDIDGVKVWYFPSKRVRRLYWSPPMKRALEKQMWDFDMLHLHSIFLWPTWAAARIARKFNKPYIISPHGMLVKDLINRKGSIAKKIWITLVERKNIENAAGLHMTTQTEMVEAIKFGFNLPQIILIPFGIDQDELSKVSNNISPDIVRIIKQKPFFLFLGRINWKKGLDRLIPALVHAPGIPLVIAGNDEEDYRPKLESIAASYGVSDRITFTGPVYGDDKAALLQNASVLVLPSYSENFGNVILEAMVVGCPVVVTPEVGLADIVQISAAGLVVNGGPEILGEKLRSIVDNPREREEMGKRGKQVVGSHFSWNTIAMQMESFYKLYSQVRG
jgi:glycosyltransferase involved in cell wall biosynthesis